MKLIKTIEKIVSEAKENYELACDKGEKPEILDRLEKKYFDSIKLMKLYNSINKKS